MKGIQSEVFSKGDPRWLEIRKSFITATDMGSLFGLRKYSSPSKILEQKANPTFVDNEYTRMGRILEPAVVPATEEALNINVERFGDKGNLIYYDYSQRISATPDAYEEGPNGEVLTVIELKTTSPNKLSLWKVDPPLDYLIQLATQCMLLKQDHGMLSILGVLYPTMPVVIFKFTGNEDIYSRLRSEVLRFWDAVESNKSYRVDSAMKKEMTSLLLDNTSILYTCGLPYLTIDWNTNG